MKNVDEQLFSSNPEKLVDQMKSKEARNFEVVENDQPKQYNAREMEMLLDKLVELKNSQIDA